MRSGHGARPSARTVIAALLTLGAIAGVTLEVVRPSPAASARRNRYEVPYVAKTDVQYIDAMVPHHEHALEMAEMEVKKGTRSEVKAMAAEMIAMQQDEIAMLKAVREELTGRSNVPKPPRDPHMANDMRDLHAATGAEVDCSSAT